MVSYIVYSWAIISTSRDPDGHLADIIKNEPHSKKQLRWLCLSKNKHIMPKLAALILGNIQYVYDLAPWWGLYISFSLSEALKAETRKAFSNNQSWWACRKVCLSAAICADLKCLYKFLQ
jgi:hypothetical protein